MESMESLLSNARGAKPARNYYRQYINDRVTGIAIQYEQGTYSPYIIAWDSIPIYILLVSVFCLHYFKGVRVKYARYLAFALLTGYSLWIITHVRFLALGYGYGLGLAFAVNIMNSAAFLIFNDPTIDYKRLEQLPEKGHVQGTSSSVTKASAFEQMPGNGHVQHRKELNGRTSSTSSQLDSHEDPNSHQEQSLYHWQPYPSKFLHRLDWIIDLVTSFRGPAWNWRLHTIEPLSKDPLSDLPRPASQVTKRDFYTCEVFRFVILYLTLDVIKTLLMFDPYFVGVASLTSPAPQWLSTLFPHLSTSLIFLRIYRLTISCASVVIALSYVFHLQPLFYGLLVPRLLPTPHYTPLSEPFLYPPQQNSFLNVLDHGLSGWWGQWWHQMFRYGISEPARFIVTKQLRWSPKSLKARILQVMISFTITGMLHFAGSYTTYASSHPSREFLFFFIQGIGLLLQHFICKNFLGDLISKLPQWLRRVGNLLAVAMWFYYTGPLFADDVATSGIWSFEIVPFSLLRGLGLGLEGEGWNCLHGPYLVYWQGEKWWRRGWAIV